MEGGLSQFGGSCRVLIPTMDDGQGLLFGSAPSISLHTWVQQGFPVTLVTDVRTQTHSGKTTAYRRFDRPIKAWDALRIPAWLTFWRGSFQCPKRMRADPPSTLGILRFIVFWSSLHCHHQAIACFTIVALTSIHTKQNHHSPSTPYSNFAGHFSQCYREFKNEKGRSLNAFRQLIECTTTMIVAAIMRGGRWGQWGT